MKTFLLFISMIFCYCAFGQHKSCCQNEDSLNIISLDFYNKKLSPDNSLKFKRNEIYQVKITDINLNVYKVEIENIDSTLTEPLDLSAISGLAGFDWSGLVAGINSFTTSFKGMKLDTNNKSLQESIKDKLDKHLQHLKKYSLQLDTTVNNFKDSIEEWSTMIEMSKLLYAPDSLKFDGLQIINKSYKTYIKHLDQIEKGVKKEMDGFNKLYSTHLEIEKLHKPESDSIKAGYKELLSLIDKAKKIISDEKRIEFISEYVDIINNSSRTYISLPLQFTGDRTELKINITPQDSASKLPSYHTKYILRPKTRMYVGVSPGIYGTNLNNTNYSILGTTINDSTGEYRLVEEVGSKHEFGATANVKFGAKFHCLNDLLGAHATLGIAVSLTNPSNIRALYGAGFSFGDRHNITVDAGLISGNVSVLSNAYNLDDTYSKLPENVTVSQMRTSYFISMGYIFVF